MGLAETAVLAVELKLNGVSVFVSGVAEADAAAATLGKTAAKTTNILGGTGTNFGLVKQAAKGLSTELSAMGSHLKGVLTGPLGMIGLGAGLFGLASIITGAVKEAADFSENVMKVAAATGLAIPAASAMVDTLDKWGVSTDRLLPILGKLEKNVGTIASTSIKAGATADQLATAHEKVRLAQVKLNEVNDKSNATDSQRLAAQQRLAQAERTLAETQAKTTMTVSGAVAFQKQYGVSLLDSSGKIADANELLLRSADYFNSSATATQKATFMSKLYGKGWQDLIPILAKGSDFIRAQEADAIHLTSAQIENSNKYRAALRDFQDTFGDAQVKIGATIMPGITDALRSVTTWLDANADKVADFFGKGMQAVREFGGFVSGSIIPALQGLASTAKGFWEAIPAPLRDILVKGFVADRTIHFLLGVSPINLAKNLIGDILGPIIGNFAARGSSPANPVFVVDAGGGLPGGGGGFLGAASKFIIPVTIAAITVGAAKVLTDAIDPGLSAAINDPTGAHGTPLGQRDPRRFNSAGQVVQNVLPALGKSAADLAEAASQTRNTARMFDDTAQNNAEAASQLRNSAHGLNEASGSIKKTAEEALGIYAASAKARGFVYDPKAPASTSLASRFAFLAAGHSGAKDVAVADALATHFESGSTPLYRSSKNLEAAIKVLTADQKTVGAKAAAAIGADIVRLKTELASRTKDAAQKTAAAARAAGIKTAAAIRDKDLSVRINQVNRTSTYINGRLLDANLNRYTSISKTSTGAGTAGNGGY